jgi:predicted esterase
MWIHLFLAVLALFAPAVGDPEQRDPAQPGAATHTVFAWKNKGGLRYTWWLPKDYAKDKPRNLTVICHGTGLDYRWGYLNNPVDSFRSDDIVISVDGPTPNGDTRLFMGESKDAKAIHDFLAELRATFAVDRVYLYGHSQGGFFVVYYAGEFPDDVAGVVAHASGAWNWSKTGKEVHKVAISFMHGTADPVVPYGQSPGSRDAYVEAKFPLIHLRRLQLYNHWPNAVRADEELDWCEGMTATTPAEALACARAILRPKPSDEYQWETVVGFSGARDVLRRLVGQGPAPFADVPSEVKTQAQALIDAVEAEGAKHVDALRKVLGANKTLALDGKPWLGHLVALREDFRGVDSVEAFVKELGYDKLAAAHAKAAGDIFKAWYDEKDPRKMYEAIVGAIDGAYLFEGFPPELAGKLDELRKDEKKLGVSKKASKDFAAVGLWKDGWKKGREAYQDIWKKWKL